MVQHDHYTIYTAGTSRLAGPRYTTSRRRREWEGGVLLLLPMHVGRQKGTFHWKKRSSPRLKANGTVRRGLCFSTILRGIRILCSSRQRSLSQLSKMTDEQALTSIAPVRALHLYREGRDARTPAAAPRCCSDGVSSCWPTPEQPCSLQSWACTRCKSRRRRRRPTTPCRTNGRWQ